MNNEIRVKLLLSAQRALLTNVTRQMRAVSLDFDEVRNQITVRFTFDTEPNDSVRDVGSCVTAEIIGDFEASWIISEEYLVCPVPDKMEHLRLLVYHRCEDEWIENAY